MTSTLSIPTEPDQHRMQRDRSVRLRQVMQQQDVGAILLLGNSNVAYATGASWPLSDAGRALLDRPVALVLADDEWPHLFTPYPALASSGIRLPEDHVHGPAYLEFEEGVRAFGRWLAELVPDKRRWAIDELPGAINRHRELVFPTGDPANGDDVIGAAKLVKTPDELGFLRAALAITEQAIEPVQAALAPGVRQSDLTAQFFRTAFECGADANVLDPIWQVMPSSLADGPWTTHGDVACPLLTTERELVKGDVLWVDTGISYAGLASDFGRTWLVGTEPSPRQRAQFEAWRDIVDAVLSVTRAGATGADLTHAALKLGNGRQPWMKHFYLGHGLGVESAEAPFIGTDLGEAYDERQELATGMVVVLEPLVWDEGASGYRAEEVIAIDDDGWIPLTDYPYSPYAD